MGEFTDLASLVMDEIALEGLDGITIEGLFVRLLERPEFASSLNDAYKDYIWEIITRMSEIDMFELPEPRKPLIIFNRYDYVDPELGMVLEPNVLPEEIYPYSPVDDKQNNVRGSCATYKQRKSVYSEASKLPLKEVLERWGTQLVLEASQKMRNLALMGSSVDPELELTIIQYCILERIGRSRHLGEVTQGKVSLQVTGEDPKALFYHRKFLMKNGLIVKQIHHQKSGVQNCSGSLLHLPRFYVERWPKVLLLTKRVIEILRSRKDCIADYEEIRRKLGLTNSLKKLFQTAYFQRFVRTDLRLPYRHLYPDAKVREWKSNNTQKEKMIRVIQLMDPNADIEALSARDDDFDGDDEDHAEGSSQLEFKTALNRSFLTQAYECVEAAGVNGYSQMELVHKMGLPKLNARTVSRNLLKRGVASTFMNDVGRQRVARFRARKWDQECTRMRSIERDIQNMRAELLSKALGAGHEVMGSSSPSTPKDSPKRPAETSVDELRAESAENDRGTKRTSDLTGSEPPAKVAKSEGLEVASSSSNTGIVIEQGPSILELEKLSGAKDDIRSLSPYMSMLPSYICDKFPTKESMRKYFQHQSKETPVMTYRIFKRINMILEYVRIHKVVDDHSKFLKLINEQEEREGLKMKMDKKSLLRLLIRLKEDGYLKLLSYVLTDGVKTKRMLFICERKVPLDHPSVVSAIEQAKMKLFIVNRENINLSVAGIGEKTPPARKQQSAKKQKITFVYDKTIGRKYGFCPKFVRMRTLHQFLYYLVYGYEGDLSLDQNHVVPLLQSKDVLVDDVLRSELTQVYNMDVSWKMFIPPLPDYIGWPQGWSIMCDLLLRLPLSLFVKVFNVSYVVVGLQEYLQHPVRRHFLVRQLPGPMRNGLMALRKYIFSIHEVLQRLCYIGLLQFGPQRLKEKDQVLVFLNRRTTLLDTVKSNPGYHQISEGTYPEIRYEFNTMRDVESYWYNLWNICLHTQLGGRMCVQGKDIVLEQLSTKPQMQTALEPVRPSLAPQNDIGHVPGDRRGAAGLDSAIFAHLKRNWNWLSASSLKLMETPGAKKMDRRSHQLMNLKAAPVIFTKSSIIVKRSINFLHNGRFSTVRPERQGVTPVAVTPPPGAEILPKKKPKERRNIVRRIEPRKPRGSSRPYYDSVDLKALQLMSKLRVDWSIEEDMLLLLCKVASVYLCPNPRQQTIAFSTIRDILHASIPEAKNKTSRACQRRILYMIKNLATSNNLAMNLEELKQDEDIVQRFGRPEDNMRGPNELVKDFEERIHEKYKLLVTELQGRSDRLVTTSGSYCTTIPDTVAEFWKTFDVVEPKTVIKHKGVFQEVKNVVDIHCAVVNAIIHSSLCSSADKTSWAYQLFRVYQQYPDSLLRAAMAKIRQDQMVSMKKSYARHTQKGNYLPLSSCPYQLSVTYSQLLQTKYQFGVYHEAHEMVKETLQWKGSAKDVRGMPVTNASGGAAAAMVELLCQKAIFLPVEIPEQIIILDPWISEKDETYTRIVARYKDILQNYRTGRDTTTSALFRRNQVSKGSPNRETEGETSEIDAEVIDKEDIPTDSLETEANEKDKGDVEESVKTPETSTLSAEKAESVNLDNQIIASTSADTSCTAEIINSSLSVPVSESATKSTSAPEEATTSRKEPMATSVVSMEVDELSHPTCEDKLYDDEEEDDDRCDLSPTRLVIDEESDKSTIESNAEIVSQSAEFEKSVLPTQEVDEELCVKKVTWVCGENDNPGERESYKAGKTTSASSELHALQRVELDNSSHKALHENQGKSLLSVYSEAQLPKDSGEALATKVPVSTSKKEIGIPEDKSLSSHTTTPTTITLLGNVSFSEDDTSINGNKADSAKYILGDKEKRESEETTDEESLKLSQLLEKNQLSFPLPDMKRHEQQCEPTIPESTMPQSYKESHTSSQPLSSSSSSDVNSTASLQSSEKTSHVKEASPPLQLVSAHQESFVQSKDFPLSPVNILPFHSDPSVSENSFPTGKVPVPENEVFTPDTRSLSHNISQHHRHLQQPSPLASATPVRSDSHSVLSSVQQPSETLQKPSEQDAVFTDSSESSLPVQKPAEREQHAFEPDTPQTTLSSEKLTPRPLLTTPPPPPPSLKPPIFSSLPRPPLPSCLPLLQPPLPSSPPPLQPPLPSSPPPPPPPLPSSPPPPSPPSPSIKEIEKPPEHDGISIDLSKSFLPALQPIQGEHATESVMSRTFSLSPCNIMSSEDEESIPKLSLTPPPPPLPLSPPPPLPPLPTSPPPPSPPLPSSEAHETVCDYDPKSINLSDISLSTQEPEAKEQHLSESRIAPTSSSSPSNPVPHGQPTSQLSPPLCKPLGEAHHSPPDHEAMSIDSSESSLPVQPPAKHPCESHIPPKSSSSPSNNVPHGQPTSQPSPPPCKPSSEVHHSPPYHEAMSIDSSESSLPVQPPAKHPSESHIPPASSLSPSNNVPHGQPTSQLSPPPCKPSSEAHHSPPDHDAMSVDSPESFLGDQLRGKPSDPHIPPASSLSPCSNVHSGKLISGSPESITKRSTEVVLAPQHETMSIDSSKSSLPLQPPVKAAQNPSESHIPPTTSVSPCSNVLSGESMPRPPVSHAKSPTEALFTPQHEAMSVDSDQQPSSMQVTETEKKEKHVSDSQKFPVSPCNKEPRDLSPSQTTPSPNQVCSPSEEKMVVEETHLPSVPTDLNMSSPMLQDNHSDNETHARDPGTLITETQEAKDNNVHAHLKQPQQSLLSGSLTIENLPSGSATDLHQLSSTQTAAPAPVDAATSKEVMSSLDEPLPSTSASAIQKDLEARKLVEDSEDNSHSKPSKVMQKTLNKEWRRLQFTWVTDKDWEGEDNGDASGDQPPVVSEELEAMEEPEEEKMLMQYADVDGETDEAESGALNNQQTLVARAATRIALFMMHEEMDESSNVNNKQHAHDFFVVNSCSVFCQLSAKLMELRSTKGEEEIEKYIKPLKQELIDEVLDGVKSKMIVNVDVNQDTVRAAFLERASPEHWQVVCALVRYVESKKHLGATLRQLRVHYAHRLTELSLAQTLALLDQHWVVVRTGITILRYVHKRHLRPWVVHTFKFLRLEREKRIPISARVVSCSPEEDSGDCSDAQIKQSTEGEDDKGQESLVVDVEEIPKEEVVKLDETKTTDEVQDIDVDENTESSGVEKKEGSESDMEIEMVSKTDTEKPNDQERMEVDGEDSKSDSVIEDVTEKREPVLKTDEIDDSPVTGTVLKSKEMRKVAEKLDVGDSEPIHVAIRPWVRINGTLNRRVLDRLLGSVMGHAMFQPSQTLDAFGRRFQPALQPVHTRELVEILQKLGCVKLLVRVKKQKVTLFSKPQPVVLVEASGAEEENEILVEPQVDAIGRLGQFIGDKKYTQDFLAAQENLFSGPKRSEGRRNFQRDASRKMQGAKGKSKHVTAPSVSKDIEDSASDEDDYIVDSAEEGIV